MFIIVDNVDTSLTYINDSISSNFDLIDKIIVVSLIMYIFIDLIVSIYKEYNKQQINQNKKLREEFRILENKVAFLTIRDKKREEEIEHFIENSIIDKARYKFADKLVENQYKINVKFKKVIQQVNQLKKILA